MATTLGSTIASELEAAEAARSGAGGGFQMAGLSVGGPTQSWREPGAAMPPLPSPPKPVEMAPKSGKPEEYDPPLVAAIGMGKRSPAMGAALADPAGTIEATTGGTVDQLLAELKALYKDDAPDPDSLTRDEKGRLLMALGFGVMTGGPGLIPAIGQAGLRMLSDWQDIKKGKERRGEISRRGKAGVIGAELDVAMAREKGAEPPPTRQVQIGTEIVTEQFDPATGTWAEIGRGPKWSPEEATAGGRPTALMQNAEWYARVTGKPIDEAADFLLMGATARGRDPEQLRNRLFEVALRETGDPDEAARVVSRSMELLNPDPSAPPPPPPEPEETGLIGRVIDQAIAGIQAGVEAAVPQPAAEVTQPMPPMEAAPAPLPSDPTALVVGQVYQAPDGRLGRWNGAEFEEVGR